MQADELKRPENRRFQQLREYFRSRTLRSTLKGLLIAAGCIALFSTGVFLGLRTSFQEAPVSGTYSPEPGAFNPSEQEPSTHDSPGDDDPSTDPLSSGTQEPSGGEALGDGDTTGPAEENPAEGGNDGLQASQPFDLDGIIIPVSGQIIKRPGWFYSEEMGDWRYYPGVAISATPGAEVKAAGTGVIKRIYRDEDLGLVIVIGHGDRYESRYAGVSASGLVTGQQVSKGETIGRTKGDILHFELLDKGEAVDPAAFPSDGN